MLKGSIYQEIIRPAIRGMSSGERHHPVRIPYRMVDKMEQNIRGIADITRTDNPFGDKRKGNVILRKRMMAVV
jgi:hypothetical protein